MTNAPLTSFVQGMFAHNRQISELEEVRIVSDNPAILSDSARDQVKLRFGPPTAGFCRWDSLKNNTKESSANNKANNCCPVCPHRRTSLEAGADRWSACSSDVQDKNLPPRDPTKRSQLRWALALDEMLGAYDDDCSETTNDESSHYLEDSDSHSDVSDDDDASDNDSSTSSSFCEDEDGLDFESRWADEKKTPHAWTLPAYCILPSVQEMLWEAAQDPNFDMNERLRMLARPLA
ncbi:hypothetical protein SEMRO_845_G210080.1 [Seminavis robusta]|uniref:Uncharacterized protein n=1 Tax=Seminavis robusta TaxID=568900 RepID=A0A9N8E9K1_9STRA|nr:hypothetical protein SEMRO_845_G210080.1 [Seminavis robusta]|eukprot:Sro845_g210080.1 n/a (235) ;mRNA; r:39666-40370